MKKTIRPSPLMMIFFGVASVICVGISIVEFADGNSTSAGTIAADFLVIGVFIYYVVKFCSFETVEFDEYSFTVAGKSYVYDEITNVIVNNEQVLRSVSTLRIKLYIGEDEVASFTKDDKGGKEFIDVMKKHGITVSIDV